MNKKQTSKPVARKASQILRDGRYSNKAKSVAGSALAQTRKGKKQISLRVETGLKICLPALWGQLKNTSSENTDSIDNRTNVWYIYYIATLGTKSRNTVQRNIERL